MKKIIDLRNITVSYGDNTILENLNLYINEKEFITLLGPSGCGKTTTLRAIAGFVKVDSGDVIFEGKRINDVPPHKRRVNTIFQRYALFSHLNVYDNINYFCGLYIRDKKQRKQYVDDAINLVGLNDFKKFLPKQLSGGLLRRLNIACGIAHKPKLIFLDEPTVAVDPQSRNHILDGIKKLRDQGATIVYTTHYMEEVEILCNRIIILDKGKIIAQGTSDELKKEANIEEKIERVGPTLNDVFLKLTGKELRD